MALQGLGVGVLKGRVLVSTRGGTLCLCVPVRRVVVAEHSERTLDGDALRIHRHDEHRLLCVSLQACTRAGVRCFAAVRRGALPGTRGAAGTLRVLTGPSVRVLPIRIATLHRGSIAPLDHHLRPISMLGVLAPSHCCGAGGVRGMGDSARDGTRKCSKGVLREYA